MNSFKKMMMKRAVKKKTKEIQSVVKRAYRDVSKDLHNRFSTMKPLKNTLSR